VGSSRAERGNGKNKEAATLIIQTLVVALLALYAWAGTVKSMRPVSDFYVAGRLVPAVFNGMAIAICLLPVLAFAGFAGTLRQGWDGASLLALGGVGGLLVIALLIAPYLRKFGGYTVPDFLAERFGGAGVGPVAVLAVILCSFPALALTLLGLGAVVTRIFAVDLGLGLAIAAAMLLLCSFAAGLRSASLTQIVQYAVFVAASLAMLVLLLWRQGAIMPVLDPARLETAFATLTLPTFAAEDGTNRFALLFCLVAGIASLPTLLTRSLVTPSIEEARASFLWALPLAAVLGALASPYVLLFGPGPDASAGLEPSLSYGLAAIGVIAGLLAIGSALLLALGNTLAYDLYYKSVHRTASTEVRMRSAQAALLLVAGLAAWAALAAPATVIDMSGAAFSLAASALLPAVLLGIWWKRATGEGALAGMLAGLIVCLYYLLAPRYIPFAFYETSSFLSNATADEAGRYAALQQNYYLADESARTAALASWEETARAVANWGGVSRDFAALFAVPVGVLVTIGVSLFTPAPSREVQSFVEDLRKTQAA
jgi:cation/acetate symporter